MSHMRPSRLLVFAITASGLLSNSVLVSSTPEILRDLGHPISRAGLVVAAGAIPGIVVAPAVGFLADRYGRRRILLPCLIIFGVFGLAAGFSPTLGWLLAARIAQGVGAAGLINLAVVLIVDHWDGLDRAALIGQNSAVITVAVAVYPVLGGGITDLFGWRWMFVSYAIPLVVAGLVGLHLVADQPVQSGKVRDQVRAALVEIRRPVTGTVIVLGAIVFLLIFGLFLSLMPIHMDQKFGLGPTQRGLVAAVPALSSTVSSLLVARARARVHGGWLVYTGMFVFAGTFVIMGVASLWVLVVAAALYGLAEGLTIPTMQDLVADEAPEHLRAAVLAAWVGAVRVGQTVGPIGVTMALAYWSTGSVLVVSGLALFVVSVIATLTRTLVPRNGGGQPTLSG
ncbi:MAG: MFS transporter [Actinobacteria bacterium]|jgi:MFS family permease|nr:MFS transporter [Actinomycetota bacterium]MBT3687207.1 MFS transporter [Actinomycetota bacterium]MBT4037942.1 MFS transporter [Actinomycetota bacterium]MBT4279919.1 MFS transporter [Actinomycetota bacterium]MBT4342793.1 MFS transporter [Actinomycetota bacterium]